MNKIQGHLPRWAKLEIRREGKRGEMCTISYEEGFDPGYEKLVAKTLEAVKAIEQTADVKVDSPTPARLRIHGRMKTTTAADMIASEWLAWSSLSSMTMRDMLASAAYGAIRSIDGHGLLKEKRGRRGKPGKRR